MLHTYSLFQIPALLSTVMVGGIACGIVCGIAYGIYHFGIKTPQSGPAIGAINVNGVVGSVSLSI